MKRHGHKHEQQQGIHPPAPGGKDGHGGRHLRRMRLPENKHGRLHRQAALPGTLTRDAVLRMNARQLRALVAEMAERLGMLEGGHD